MTYSTSFAEIVAMYSERKTASQVMRNTALQVRDQYNGDIVVGVLDSADVPLAVNIAQQGVDQIAQRVCSTQPNIYFPPTTVGQDKAEKAARNRRRALYGIWDKNGMKRKDRRRARHMIAYGNSPVTVSPDMSGTYPKWNVRDPLTTYPCPSNDPDEIVPYDCIFAYKRSYRWIKSHYPHIISRRDLFPPSRNGEPNPDTQFTILEYIDDYEIVLGVIGNDTVMYQDQIVNSGIGEFERIPNRTGMPLTVIPSRINLDRLKGQFDGMLGLFSRQAEMMALSYEALKRGIIPKTWVVARQGELPTIHSVPDPDAGELGQISGGEIFEQKTDPSFMAPQMVDKIEQIQRETTGTPVEFGGTAGGGIRTGARGSQVMQSVVDFPVQELQESLEVAREAEDKVAIAIEKNYWPRKSKSIYVGWDGAKGRLDYVPKELWSTDEHSVSYSHAGADVNGLAIAAGQRMGMGSLSLKSFMEMDPLVKDPEYEYDQVTAEQFTKAIVASFQQQLAGGLIPIADGALVAEMIEKGENPVKAIIEIQKQAQERQATQDAQGAPTGVQPGSPEAQPGLAQPGTGAEAGIAGPNPDQQNLQSLLFNLRNTQMNGRPVPAGAPS